MYACAHLQLYMIISPADQNVRISRIRGCMPEYLHLRKHIAAAPLLPVHSRLTHARLELRAPTLMRHAASPGPSIMSVFYNRLFPRSYPWHQYEIGIYLPAPAKQTHFVLFQFTFYHTIAAR